MKRVALALSALLLTQAACAMNLADAPTPPDPDDPAWDDGTDVDARSDRTLLFYYGPMKIMPAEVVLISIAAFTGHDFGSWDTTTPEPTSVAFFEAGNDQGTFYRHCRQLGGCMDHRIPLGRTGFVNTAYVLQLERAAVEACNDGAAFGMFPRGEAPDDTTAMIEVIRHQHARAFGEQPDDTDIELSQAYFESHVAAPEQSGVHPLESAGRGHCRALLTTNRFLFY